MSRGFASKSQELSKCRCSRPIKLQQQAASRRSGSKQQHSCTRALVRASMSKQLLEGGRARRGVRRRGGGVQ